jgi:hypothetical protein
MLSLKESICQRSLETSNVEVTGETKDTAMNLVLDLPPELESELAAEAARIGLPLAEYAVRLLAGGGTLRPALRTGAEVLSYWQGEDLIGSRPEIEDSSAHARALREQAQRRERP